MGNTFEMNDASSEPGGIVSVDDLLVHLGISETATDQEIEIATQSLRSAEGAVIRYLQYNPVMSVRTEFYPNMDFSGSGEGRWEANDTHAYYRLAAGESGDQLQVRGLPVREADSSGNNEIDLRIDYDGRSGTRAGSFGDSTLKVEGVDFHPNYDFIDSGGRKVCRDGIIRSIGLWPSTPGSVKVTYVAGYTESELDGSDSVIDASPIREAVIDEAVRRVHKTYSRMKKRVGFGSGGLSSEDLGDYSYEANDSILKELTGSSSDLLTETMTKLENFVNHGANLAL